MKLLLILFSATASLAGQGTTYVQSTTFPVTSLIFTLVFALVTLLNIIWIFQVVKAKKNLSSSDIEQKRSLTEGDASTNISISAQNRSELSEELRHDEHLVWAHENLLPLRVLILVYMSMSLLIAAAGFTTAFSFTIIFIGNDSSFLLMWITLLLINVLLLGSSRFMQKRSNCQIDALTSKRVLIISPMTSGWWDRKTKAVRAYDLDGIHQTTVTRKEDGSGTLTFSSVAKTDTARDSRVSEVFAFVDVPNITAIRASQNAMVHRFMKLAQYFN